MEGLEDCMKQKPCTQVSGVNDTGRLFFYGAARSAGIAKHAQQLSKVEKVAPGVIYPTDRQGDGRKSSAGRLKT